MVCAPGTARAQSAPCAATTGLVDILARKLGPDEALTTGVAGDALVREAVGRACGEAEVARWLPAVCEGALGRRALIELRRRLVVDVASLPLALLPPAARSTLTDSERAARLGVAVVRALLAAGDPLSLARALREGSTETPRFSPSRPCLAVTRVSHVAAVGTSLRRLAEPSAPTDGDVVLQRAARVLEELARDPTRTDEELLAALLAAATGERQKATRPQQAAATAVITAARRLEEHRKQRREAASPEHLAAAATDLLALAEGAATLAAGRAIGVSDGSREFLRLLLAGDLGGAVAVAPAAGVSAREAASGAAGAVELPAEVARVVNAALAAGRARDEAELARAVRSWLLPWAEPWLFDLNGARPTLAGTERVLVGGVALGYNGGRWGVLAAGNVAAHDTTSESLVARNRDLRAEAEAWWTWKHGLHRLELRASGRFAELQTLTVPIRSDGVDVFLEKSLMGRGLALLGWRFEPGPDAALGLWLGLGGQIERYRDDSVLASGQANLVHTTTPSLMLNLRARAQYALWPGVITLRGRADLESFAIRRDTLAIAIGDHVTISEEASSSRRTDLHTSLFVDLEAARLLGFVPGLSAGLDVFWQTGTDTTTTPSLGLGVRREIF
jgi:hypothetical protein